MNNFFIICCFFMSFTTMSMDDPEQLSSEPSSDDVAFNEFKARYRPWPPSQPDKVKHDFRPAPPPMTAVTDGQAGLEDGGKLILIPIAKKTFADDNIPQSSPIKLFSKQHLNEIATSIINNPTKRLILWIGLVAVTGVTVISISFNIKDLDNFDRLEANTMSLDFIREQMNMRGENFSPEQCFTQCVTDFYHECFDSRQICKNNFTAIESLKNYTAQLYQALSDNCTFVTRENYTLENLESFFTNFTAELCNNSYVFGRYLVDISNGQPDWMTVSIYPQRCLGEHLDFGAGVTAGDFDATCVANSLMREPSVVWPIWLSVNSGYIFLFAAVYYCAYCI